MLWKKLITPTVAVSLFWLAVGSATIYYLDWVYSSHSQELAENFSTVQAADSMQDVLWRLQATVVEVVERADNHTRLEVAELEDAFVRHHAAAQAATTNPAAQDLVQAIGQQFATYRQQIHRRLDAESAVEADRVALQELSRAAHVIAESCKSLLTVQERLIAQATAERSRLRVALSRIMLGLWIVGPALGIGLGLWIAHRLQRSISRISISLKDAAGGLERPVGCVDVVPSEDLTGLQEQVQNVCQRIGKAVDDLQQARHEAMLAERLAAVGELAAGVAHELRNPLTSVKLLMQAAAAGRGGQDLTDEHVHVILDQVVRMENTIQGLLDFARPPRMQKTCHDLRDTLRRALNLTEGYAKQQGVVVVPQMAAVAALVDGDPEQLHQVFVNLLLNGIEAMPHGGTLRVALDLPAGDAPGMRVQFRDEGPGIAPELMPRIFEPFVTNKQRGTGLGLAISRRIVQQHGGLLLAVNCRPAGALFTVQLPPAVQDAPASAAGQRSSGTRSRERCDAQTAGH